MLFNAVPFDPNRISHSQNIMMVRRLDTACLPDIQ